MQPGKIIERATISGVEFTFRHPKKTDLNQLCDYINILSQERTFIRFQGEQVSLDQEQEYLNQLLRKVKQNEILSILAVHDGEIAGSTDIKMQEKTDRHIGLFGIVVKKQYRGQGLGTYLTDLAIKQAQKTLPGLEIVQLSVYANNERAIHLYEKFDFKQYGLLPDGIKLENGYQDRIFMYRRI